MSDESSITAARRLGTVLSAIGFAWFLLSILADMGVLSEFGLPRDLVVGLSGNFFTPVILIIAGRSVRKRAKKRTEKGETQPARPAPRPAPRPTPSPEAPRPKPEDQSESSGEPTTQRRDVMSLEEALAGLEPETEPAEESVSPSSAEQLDGTKTSAEMLEEARRKWGSDRD